MPDPKLKAAAAEILAVLKKHDIGGLVTLASPTHMEHIREIAPSWSCCWLEPENNGFTVRVRCKQEDFPSREAARKCLEETVGMLAGFADIGRLHHEQMSAVLRMVGKSVEIEHITRQEG